MDAGADMFLPCTADADHHAGRQISDRNDGISDTPRGDNEIGHTPSRGAGDSRLRDQLQEGGGERGREEEEQSRGTFFSRVVGCIVEDLRTRIISRESDLVSLVLFNTVRGIRPGRG